MAEKDPRVDQYIAAAAPFAQPILKHLRQLVHAACPDVEETIKWGLPHFEHEGNLGGMAAFKGHCTFGFWKGELIFGPEKSEEADAMGQFGRLTQLSDLPNDAVFLGYLRKAVELNEEGVQLTRAPRPKGPKVLIVPDDLKAALKQNAKAQKTFKDFSYSKRKEYVEWLTEAKRDETRQQRLATTIEWLAEGKSRMWKYERPR